MKDFFFFVKDSEKNKPYVLKVTLKKIKLFWAKKKWSFLAMVSNLFY